MILPIANRHAPRCPGMQFASSPPRSERAEMHPGEPRCSRCGSGSADCPARWRCCTRPADWVRPGPRVARRRYPVRGRGSLEAATPFRGQGQDRRFATRRVTCSLGWTGSTAWPARPKRRAAWGPSTRWPTGATTLVGAHRTARAAASPSHASETRRRTSLTSKAPRSPAATSIHPARGSRSDPGLTSGWRARPT